MTPPPLRGHRADARRRTAGALSITIWQARPMSENETLRSVDLQRIGVARYKAVNSRGGVLPIGSGEDPDFTPVELPLAAIAGRSDNDVDLLQNKRATPDAVSVRASGDHG